MSASEVTFFILAGLLVLFSLIVVIARNLVYSALALVAALFVIAILFLNLQAPMLGVLQILVYAGAIMVLFLFVIMFLSPSTLEQRRTLTWGFGSAAGLFLALIFIALVSAGQTNSLPAGTELFGTPEQLAKSLFTDFVLPFEIASVLLLVAILGAVILAQRER